jgi:ribonuclease P protein component
MLPSAHRLRKTKEIEHVWKRGRSFFAPTIQCKIVAANDRTAPTKIAFVIGTKVEKRAVKRNLWKRRAREIIRAHVSEIMPGLDIVISAKKGAIEMSFADMEKTLLGLLRSARVLR